MSTRIVVTADTHVPDFARELPPSLLRAIRRTDLVLHAGDVTSPEVLDTLAMQAPVRVALGNNDGPGVAEWGATPDVGLEVEGLAIAMVHDAGRREGRERRLARAFPHARLVVFGHSHVPMLTELEGRRFLNPGSPTWKRRQPAPTYAVVWVASGRPRFRIVEM